MSITIRSALTMAAPALALLAAAPLQAQEEGSEPQRVRVRLEKRDAETKQEQETKTDGGVDLRALIDRAVREALGEAQAPDAPKGDSKQQREVRVEKRVENGGEPQVRVWINGEEVDADAAPRWVEIAEGDDHPHGVKVLRIGRDGEGGAMGLAKILEQIEVGGVNEHIQGVLEHLGDLGDLDVDVDVDVEEILEESLGQLRGLDGSQFKVMVKGLEGLGELKMLEGLKGLEGLKVFGGKDGAFQFKIQSEDCEDCDEECEECCEEEDQEDVQILRVGGKVLRLGGKDGQNVFRFETGDGPHGAIAIVRGDDDDHDDEGEEVETRELRFGGKVIKLDGADAKAGNRRVFHFGGQGDGPGGMAVIELQSDGDASAAPQRLLRTMRQGGTDATPHMIWRTRAPGGAQDARVFARRIDADSGDVEVEVEVEEHIEADAGDVQTQIEALRAEIKALKQRLKELKQELKRGESV